MRHSLLRLNSPLFQNVMADIILAMTPGLFTALGALGAGGKGADATHVANSVNAILYSIYAVTGFFSGMLLNTVGPRFTLTAGAFGYPFYMAALWYWDRTDHSAWYYVSGAVLGCTAGWLWSTAAYVAFTYSTETNRAKYLGMQNVIIALGASIGSAVAFGLSYDKTTSGVPTAVYATFTVLMLIAVCLSGIFMIHPTKVIRDDGTHLSTFSENTNMMGEFKAIISLMKDWRILVLLPVMFCAELPLWTSSINAYAFDIRSRTLNGFLYSLAQAPIGFLLAPILDNTRFRRRTRGFMGIAVLTVLTLGTWLGTVGWMVGKDLDRSVVGPGYDWNDGAPYAGFAIIYFLLGGLYVAFPLCSQWILSSMSNSPKKLGMYAGIFKGTVAAGMVVAFGVDSTLPPFWNELGYTLALQGFSLILMAFLCYTCVSDSEYFHENDVIVPVDFVEHEKEIDPEVANLELEKHHQNAIAPVATTEKST